MADNPVSKTGEGNLVRVQVPPSAFSQMCGKNIYAWSPELAYATGLIATDGSLSSDNRHVSLTSSDIQLLNTFRTCLNLKNKITNNPNTRLTCAKRAVRSTHSPAHWDESGPILNAHYLKYLPSPREYIPRRFWLLNL